MSKVLFSYRVIHCILVISSSPLLFPYSDSFTMPQFTRHTKIHTISFLNHIKTYIDIGIDRYVLPPYNTFIQFSVLSFMCTTVFLQRFKLRFGQNGQCPALSLHLVYAHIPMNDSLSFLWYILPAHLTFAISEFTHCLE